MKTDTVFKRAFNDALDLIATLSKGDRLPSENSLSARLGVSRTTVRKILSALAERGVVTTAARERFVQSTPDGVRRFPEAETVPMSAQVEKRFMEWMLQGQCAAGNRDQRAGARAAVRRRDHRHPRVPQPLSALRADREAAECRVGVQGLHTRLRA